MNLREITTLLLQSSATANTIDDLDCAQHLFGFRSCVESVCLEISEFTSADECINEKGVHAIKNLCDRMIDAMYRDEEGLVPFIDGIKDATICLRTITENHMKEHDTDSV
jgi:hypothetical protein